MAVISLGEFEAEYRLCPHMVVFSHGFGVDRTDRGLFTDLITALPDNFGFVLFDFYDHDDQGMLFPTFLEQAKRIKAVIDWLRQQADVSSITAVAHSMGSVLLALAAPEGLQKAILLAPPLTIGDRTRQYFTTKPGARLEGDSWLVPRRDGSISRMPEALFVEMAATNVEAALYNLAENQPVLLVIAGQDEVLGPTDFEALTTQPNIQVVTIDSAGHDFASQAREQLLDLLPRQLL